MPSNQQVCTELMNRETKSSAISLELNSQNYNLMIQIIRKLIIVSYIQKKYSSVHNLLKNLQQIF